MSDISYVGDGYTYNLNRFNKKEPVTIVHTAEPIVVDPYNEIKQGGTEEEDYLKYVNPGDYDTSTQSLKEEIRRLKKIIKNQKSVIDNLLSAKVKVT